MLKHIFVWLRLPLLFLLLATTTTVAQQALTPNEQALATKLMQELQQELNCNANLLMVQADLAKANARIKELESKADKPKE